MTAPKAPVTVFRGEIQTLTLTVTGVDLVADADDVVMVLRTHDGTAIATYQVGSGVTIDSATQASVAVDATTFDTGTHLHEVWVDLTSGDRRVVVAPSPFVVRESGRYP